MIKPPSKEVRAFAARLIWGPSPVNIAFLKKMAPSRESEMAPSTSIPLPRTDWGEVEGVPEVKVDRAAEK